MGITYSGLARWTQHPSPVVAFSHATPHTVVSRVLHPDVAAFLPPGLIALRALPDYRCCVDALTFKSKHHHAPANDRDGAVSSKDVEFAASFPHLTRLNVAKSTPADLSKMSGSTKLHDLVQDLRLHDCEGMKTSTDFAPLLQFSALRRLELNWSNVRDDCFLQLAYLSQLEHLDLSFCVNVGMKALMKVFSSLHHLRHLNVSMCSGVTAQVLAEVARASCNLEYLDLSSCGNVGDAASLGELSKLRHLGQLKISSCSSVNAQSLSAISPLRQLWFLDVSLCEGIDSAAIAEVARLPNLRKLWLSGCDGVNTVGLKQLAVLRSLHRLALSFCRGVDKSSLSEIWEFSHLRYLDVRYCNNLDAEDLRQLTHRSRPRRLTVKCTRFESLLQMETNPNDCVAFEF